jgi:methylated-DNA-[protein]-cysteine S-methyltransferase
MIDATRSEPTGRPAPPEYWDELDLPFAGGTMTVTLAGRGGRLSGLHFGPADSVPGKLAGAERDPDALAEAAGQLRAYATGDREDFDLQLVLQGTAFQLEVWEALLRIPYGTTTTYGRIAADIGRPAGARAVGSAVGSNPVGIIVPCHRVVGADGSLTGFGGGLPNKVLLLSCEGALIP